MTLVVETFENWDNFPTFCTSPWLKMLKFDVLQIGLILLLFGNHYFTMVEEILRKFRNLTFWKRSRLRWFYYFLIITSPWLKKLLKFDVLKRSRLRWFYYFLIITSPWLKKILKFDVLKRSRLAYFTFFLHYFILVEENFEIWRSKTL